MARFYLTEPAEVVNIDAAQLNALVQLTLNNWSGSYYRPSNPIVKIHDLIYWKTENLRAHNSVRKEKAFHVFE